MGPHTLQAETRLPSAVTGSKDRTLKQKTCKDLALAKKSIVNAIPN